jgi:hypothetical protein
MKYMLISDANNIIVYVKTGVIEKYPLSIEQV